MKNPLLRPSPWSALLPVLLLSCCASAPAGNDGFKTVVFDVEGMT
jgi:hypothetical protein